MLNIEKYENELRKHGTYFAVTKKGVPVNCEDCECDECLFAGKNCKVKKMEWLLEEYKESILTDEEKVIIKNIIKALKPFGDEIERISKHLTANDNEYYLVFDCKYSGFNRPIFTDSELFKNMKLVKDYTLEELGL